MDHLAQRLAVHELHREEHVTVVLTLVVDGDDVGMAETRGGPGLAAEALDGDGVGRKYGAHDLEGNLAVEASIHRHVDGGHATVCEVREDAVAPVDHSADECVRHAGRHAGSLRAADGEPREVGGHGGEGGHNHFMCACTAATYFLVSANIPLVRTDRRPW